MSLLTNPRRLTNNSKSINVPKRPLKLKDGPVIYRPRGYAFVSFEEQTDLDPIIEKFTELEFKGRNIYLSYPKERVEREVKSPASEESGATTEAKPSKKKPAKKSAKKEKIPFDQGVKSLDTLHLKNLEFGVKSADIRELFANQGESVQWISVPFAKHSKAYLKKLEEQGVTGEKRNKGYAFVKLELGDGESLEDKVAKFNGQELKDREIQVSVAIDVRPKEENEESVEASTSAEAPQATEALQATEAPVTEE